LDVNGNLQYSTVFGGSGLDINQNIVINNGQAIIGGRTNSTDYPTTDGSTHFGSGYDATLTLIDGSGNLIFSTVYGGNGDDNAGFNAIPSFVRTDGTYIYTIGRTPSTDFPTTDGSTYAGGNSDIYFRKYDLSGNLITSKLFGGIQTDTPHSVELLNGEIYLLGEVGSGFPD